MDRYEAIERASDQSGMDSARDDILGLPIAN
jgi:hypothetical protein